MTLSQQVGERLLSAIANVLPQRSSKSSSQLKDCLIHDAGGSSTEQFTEDDGSAWETWDPKRSLFDNHLSDSLEANLEYMWRQFHFSIPDSEFLRDAPGLLTYLVSS